MMCRDWERGWWTASSFRTSYVPLNKQADFINGMQVAPPHTSLSSHIASALGAAVVMGIRAFISTVISTQKQNFTALPKSISRQGDQYSFSVVRASSPEIACRLCGTSCRASQT